MLEPNAWAKKYLIDASVSWLEFDLIIIGINDRRFSSIPAQRNIQLDLDMAMTVLNTIMEAHIKLKGKYIIKIWRSRTAQFKLEAWFCPAYLRRLILKILHFIHEGVPKLRLPGITFSPLVRKLCLFYIWLEEWEPIEQFQYQTQ